MPDKFNLKYRDFLIQSVLANDSDKIEKSISDRINYIKRKNVDQPTITVSINSTSVAKNALLLIKSINEYLSDRKLDVKIIPVGSLGLSSFEPIISVSLPGKTQLFYKNVFVENFISILDGTFNNFIQEENILGQLNDHILDPWEAVPYLNGHQCAMSS